MKSTANLLFRSIWLFAIILLLPIMAIAGNSESVPSAIGAVTVQDIDGHSVRLGDSWQKQPVVLVFIRQFG